MFKDTCLIAHKRKDQSHHILALEILIRRLRNKFSLHTSKDKTIIHTTQVQERLECEEEVVTRNFTEESPDSELRLKRYGCLKL
jgi:hypothetical protein